MKKIVIISGGTMSNITPHLSLCAPAFGTVGEKIKDILRSKDHKMDVVHYKTNMAGGSNLNTNADLDKLLDQIIQDMDTKIVFMPVAVCDFEVENIACSGNHTVSQDERLHADFYQLALRPYTKKILSKIRAIRKDIFLVAFSSTTGTTQQMFLKAQRIMKDSSANLVLANDLTSRLNFICTPEESIYCETYDRDKAINELIDIALLRSHLTFTRSTVVTGDRIPWSSPLVPDNLRKVIEHCVSKGAYKPVHGKTAGHFAAKLNDTLFLTSIRKTNFNLIKLHGLVLVKTDGPDSVMAYGFKPSVGGQSQRIVFTDHPELDCIVHFHCPMKPGSHIPVVSQREFECGSHECGKNTSNGLKYWTQDIAAVMLENHGPNIVFNRKTDPVLVCQFIDDNFDLSLKTGPAWDIHNV